MKASRFNQEMIEEYVKAGHWDSSIITDFWERNASLYPDSEAIVEEERRLTWGEAKKEIDSIASGLIELGIERDERVAVQLPNGADLFAFRLACEKAGVVAVTLLPTFRHGEVGPILKHTKAVGVAIARQFRNFDYFEMIEELRHGLPLLRHIFVGGEDVPEGTISLKEMSGRPPASWAADAFAKRRFSAFETFQIATTTGTTGMPKCVEFASCVRQATGRVVGKRLKMTRTDTLGAFAPVIAGGCFNEAYRAAPMTGTRIVVAKYFTPEEVLGLIEKERVTVWSSVPAIVARVIDYPDFDRYDISSLRIVKYGGAPFPPEQGLKVWQKFGLPGLPAYGGLDAGTISSSSTDDGKDSLLRTVGRPLDGNIVRLVDENNCEVPAGEIGEVCVKGPHCEPGYYGDPEATRAVWADGWFHTGDLALVDDQGRIEIRGRRKDMIIRGGQNIYPLEVESLLLKHPKVLKAAVVGIPDERMGEKTCACVILKQGESVGLSDIVLFFKELGCAPFKIPERLEIMEDFPLVSGIKVDKAALAREVIGRGKR